MPHPFRFIASMPPLTGYPRVWRDALLKIEDLGFSSVSVSDHFTSGWAIEPIVAMTAATQSTSRLRVLSLVFSNDYRHPVLLQKAMATLDVLSGGRVELGLGAGWMRDEYEAIDLPFDRPGTRVGRLEESVILVKELFGNAPGEPHGQALPHLCGRRLAEAGSTPPTHRCSSLVAADGCSPLPAVRPTSPV
jgi:alkanesulfonate monooxygenase SsuD/methylene tetrahydromethanopterin reductase-like flavin-dependent oxidoreductase (luciferase family)